MGFGRAHSLSCKSFILFTPLYAGSVDALCRRRLCEPLKAFCCLFFCRIRCFVRPPTPLLPSLPFPDTLFSGSPYLHVFFLPMRLSLLCALSCAYLSLLVRLSLVRLSLLVYLSLLMRCLLCICLFSCTCLFLCVCLPRTYVSLLMCCPFSCTRLFSSTSLLCLFSYCLCPFRYTSYSSCHRSYLLQHAYSS